MRWQHELIGDVMDEMGVLIRNLRKSKKYTQQELADKVGVHRTVIIKLEKGGNTSLLVFMKVLKAFNRVDQVEPILFSSQVSAKEMFEKQEKERKKNGGYLPHHARR